MTRSGHFRRSDLFLTMASMRHLIAPILGVAVAGVLGIGAQSMAATHQGPSTASSAGPREQGNSKADAPESDGPEGPSARSAQMVAIARAHRDGMRRWRQCTATARASNSSTAKCIKPLPPGWVKHPKKHSGADSPGQGKSDSAHGTRPPTVGGT